MTHLVADEVPWWGRVFERFLVTYYPFWSLRRPDIVVIVRPQFFPHGGGSVELQDHWNTKIVVASDGNEVSRRALGHETRRFAIPSASISKQRRGRKTICCKKTGQEN